MTCGQKETKAERYRRKKEELETVEERFISEELFAALRAAQAAQGSETGDGGQGTKDCLPGPGRALCAGTGALPEGDAGGAGHSGSLGDGVCQSKGKTDHTPDLGPHGAPQPTGVREFKA